VGIFRRDIAFNLLLSRFLTRSGDQAWLFALPVALLVLLPADTALVIGVFLVSKFATLLILPLLAGVVDTWPRLHTATFGTAVQAVGVLGSTGCVFALHGLGLRANSSHVLTNTPVFFAVVGTLVAFSVLSALGSDLMKIAIGNDWIPALIPPSDLARVNRGY